MTVLLDLPEELLIKVQKAIDFLPCFLNLFVYASGR